MELEQWSEALGTAVRLAATPPAGADGRVVWLLHGRGASFSDVCAVIDGLAAAMDAGRLRRRTVVAPWAPWLDGASWWVDSPGLDGGPLESALLSDVLPQVEAGWGLEPTADLRTVAGYSMGGAAALRWLLTRSDLFGSAALVSPASYAAGPPLASSARTCGAFRSASRAFDQPTWETLLSYRRQLSALRPDAAPLRVRIVVGDGEPVEAYPGQRSSLVLEAARLHLALTDAPEVESALRVVSGGHTDDFWVPALVLALGLLDGS